MNRLTGTAVDDCQDYRADTTLGFVHAAHALVTNYKYNSLNQVREQSTPDGGVTRFWYDALGRLIVSQNAKQADQTPDSAYSYTIYDALGRIIEVGQLYSSSGAPGDFITTAEYEAWLSNSTGHEQVTHTVYDVAINTTLIQTQDVVQENLRNRISCVLYQQTRVQLSGGTFFDPDLSEYDYASYYSYDVHGNVKTVVHDDQLFRNMFGTVEITKKIDYLYDLVSGSVKEVIYQQTKADEFRHRYHYDADNRITHVYTSRNGMIWQRDAKYFYYPHGPLARVEVGHEQVQAFDYAYTLHGWLKGVNTNTLVAGTDIGNDGRGDETNPNRWFGQDAAGFSLGYYSGDYQAIGQNGGDFLNANLQNVYSSGSDLFNGNISHMVTAIHEAMTPSGFTPVPQATTYRYDRLNRIKQMKAYQGTVNNGVWTAQTTETYSSAYKYDFNGNITELERYAGVDKIDDLEYYYDHANHADKLGLVSNRLYLVDEQSTHPGGNDLKKGDLEGADFNPNTPSSWNYHYDPIGNLIKDVNDSIDLITWTVTGKVNEVVFDPAKQNYNLAFRYDPMGNRIAKIQKPHNSLANCTTWTVTWYSVDAQGNVLAVYNKATDSLNFRATEFNIYGSSRIGMVTQPEALNETPQVPMAHSQTLGLKVYEFSNHLGNVLTTFSDRKIATEGAPGYVAYYTAEILSSTDYYPFGFEMPGRSYTGGGYRYGYQGSEKDDEINGSGNSYTTFYRLLDPRIGRWFSLDPVTCHFESPYVSMGNNPIWHNDILGDKFDEKSQKILNGFKEKTKEKITNLEKEIKSLTGNDENTLNKRNELLAQKNELEEMMNEIGILEASANWYSIERKISTSDGKTANHEGIIKYDGIVRITFSADASLAHELKHAYQFEVGNVDFQLNDKGEYIPGYTYDITDEVEAFKRGHAFSANTSPFSSLSQITPQSVALIDPHYQKLYDRSGEQSLNVFNSRHKIMDAYSLENNYEKYRKTMYGEYPWVIKSQRAQMELQQKRAFIDRWLPKHNVD